MSQESIWYTVPLTPVIKVQDGCSQGCAYCIIPLTRGPSRSRPVEDIVAEAHRLLASGHREILLSGVNLRQFFGSRRYQEIEDSIKLVERYYYNEYPYYIFNDPEL